MLNNLKALVVVLAIAFAVFWAAKPFALRFMTEADYIRRRNVWGMLTFTAFVSPSFWLYLVVAGPLLVWAGAKDKNPMALTLLLLQVIPPVSAELPTVAINRLFELNNYRVLAFAVLLPAVFRIRSQTSQVAGSFRFFDICVIAYALLQLVLLLPYESLTNTMRRMFLYGVDVGLFYYVFSRLSMQREKVVESLACFALSLVFIASIAVFEWGKGWLLYTGINEQWGDPNLFSWLLRDGNLRAQASVGHALALGYMCAMGLGMWLFLQRRIDLRWARWGVTLLIIAGGYVTISRGPWLVAVTVYLSYCLLAPFSATQVMHRFAALALLSVGALLSPYGSSIIDYLPFVGSVDAKNVTYRQELATMSWELIKQHPFLGNPFVLTQMESLRQGQGIIDLVNVYASVAMFYGGVGLLIFLAPFVVGAWRVIALARATRQFASTDTGALAAALAACMLGTLVMLAVGSFGTILAVLYWAFVGIAAGLTTSQRQEGLTLKHHRSSFSRKSSLASGRLHSSS